jgi:hypothetical protein
MIGGQDIVIPCAEPKVALDVATRIIRRRWRDCLAEDGETGNPLPPYGQMGFAGLSEILFNKTAQTSQLWEELGSCEATNGTLIHLLAGANTLTVVVDDEPTLEMKSIVSEIRGALIQDLFASRATDHPEAA